MKSTMPKVLHKLAGRSMLEHVLALAQDVGSKPIAAVIAPHMATVEAAARAAVSDIEVYVQASQQGTADAVLAARDALVRHDGDVLVLYADTPLIRPQTIARLRTRLDLGAAIAVLGFRSHNPAGYGRLITDGRDELVAIREDKEATESERRIDLCNSGVMAFRVPQLAELLSRIENTNS